MGLVEEHAKLNDLNGKGAISDMEYEDAFISYNWRNKSEQR